MIARVTIALLVLLCVACAPRSFQELNRPYGAGAGYGYSDQRLDDRRFVVTYRAPVETGFTFAGEAGQQAARKELDRSYDFALAHAAEIALANGYPAFRVEDRRNDASSQDYQAWSHPTGPPFAQRRVYSMDEAYLAAGVTLIVALTPQLEPGAFDARATLETIRDRYAPTSG
jgi:hypothetical protein